MAAEVVINVKAEDNFSGVLGNFGNIMTGILSTVQLAVGAFQALAAPVIDFGMESILAAARVSELAVVNEVLARNAGINLGVIPPLVEAIRKQGIEAAVAQTVMASFIDAHLDLSKAVDLSRVAQDAAVISGENSTATLNNLIYGITTINPLVLRHAGIIVDLKLAYEEWATANEMSVEEMTTTQKQTVALNAVLAAGADIAGAYAAAMEEPGKVLRSFPRYFDDIMVAVGEPFQEAFGNVIFELADVAKWLGVAVSEGGFLRPVLDDIAGGVEYLTSVFVPLSDTIQTVVEYLGGEIGLRRVLYDVGLSMKELGLTELADALFRVSTLVGDGTSIWRGFELVLQDLAAGDSPLARISEYILGLGTAFDTGGIGAVIDTFIATIFQSISDEIDDWTAGAGPLTLTLKMIAWIDNIGEGEEITTKSKAAAGNLVTALVKAVGGVEWGLVATAIDLKLAETIENYDWRAAGESFRKSIINAFTNIDIGEEDFLLRILLPTVYYVQTFFEDTATGQALSDAISQWFSGVFSNTIFTFGFDDIWEIFWNDMVTGWENADPLGKIVLSFGWDDIWQGINDSFTRAKIIENIKSVFLFGFDDIIKAVKEFLGIASPSSVFADIGRDIVLGLISGVGQMWDTFSDFIQDKLGNLLDNLSWENILKVITGQMTLSQLFDSGATGSIGGFGGTGSIGGYSTGGGGMGGTGTTVNQYFAGATINVGSWDEIAYDCIYPNPFVAATSGQLGGGVVRR